MYRSSMLVMVRVTTELRMMMVTSGASRMVERRRLAYYIEWLTKAFGFL